MLLSIAKNIFGGSKGSGAGLDSAELRDSFPGAFVHDEDWDAFLQLFTPTTIASINDHVPLHKFIIVTEGELSICVRAHSESVPLLTRAQSSDDWFARQLPPNDTPSELSGEASTIRKNGLFIMFGTDYTESSESLLYDHVETIFRSKLKDKKLSFYSASLETITQFMTSRSYLSPLLSVINFSLSETIKDHPIFAGLTAKQINSLGPLMRVVTIAEGTTLTQEGVGYSDYDNAVMAILLHGSLVHISPEVDVNSLHLLVSRHAIINGGEACKGLSPRTGDKSKKVVPTDCAIDYAALGTALQVGACVGITMCLYKDCRSLKTIVASSNCVVALLSRKALFRLASIRSYVMKAMQMNLVHGMLETLKHTVPLLRDIREGELRRLAVKMGCLTVEEGESVYSQGDIASRFYLVHSGEIKIESADAPGRGKLISPGSYFGEVSLITAGTHKYSATATQRSMLIAVEGNDFRHVFDSTVDKQSESAIQQAGEKVDLVHILRSHKGYSAFMAFLELEHSTEGLLFWQSVDRYEDMCTRIFNKHHVDTAQTTSDDVDYHMLHEMALCIMNRFIYDGAVNQVNIQGNLRKQVERAFNTLTEAYEAGSAASIPESVESPEGGVDSGYRVLFKKPKSEIFGLLKTDNQMRWKETSDFQAFISDLLSA